MELNKFFWTSFIESSEGVKWSRFFLDLQDSLDPLEKLLNDGGKIWGVRGYFLPMEDQLDLLREAKEYIIRLRKLQNDGQIPTRLENTAEAARVYKLIGELEDSDGEYEYYAEDIPALSIALFFLYPKYFFPYFFYPNFYLLELICYEFRIFIPKPPGSRSYAEKFDYYWDICQCLHEFWSNKGFLPDELPIFLFGFAPNMLSRGNGLNDSLPEARRVWLVGAGGPGNEADFITLDKATPETVLYWTNSPHAEVGDIVLVYCLRPRSYIHSIWRCATDGSVEPFRTYKATGILRDCIKIPPICLADLRKDSNLSKMPVVRRNMLGLNGIQVSTVDYSHFLDLLNARGVNTKLLPRLEDTGADVICVNERDVELQILEPLLKRLGFNESQWKRQVILQVGREDKVIPDYLIFPDFSSETPSAKWVWEAKFSMTSSSQINESLGQAASYARLVGAKGLGVVSVEGVWICIREGNLFCQNAEFFSMKSIKSIDGFNNLAKSVGVKAVSK